MSDINKTSNEIPQFWILALDSKGELGDAEGYWTKEQRQQRAIDLLETNWTVTYSWATLMAESRIREVLRYWHDMRKAAEDNLRDHSEANPTGCPVGCEQCANLLREYDATLAPKS